MGFLLWFLGALAVSALLGRIARFAVRESLSCLSLKRGWIDRGATGASVFASVFANALILGSGYSLAGILALGFGAGSLFWRD